MVTGLKPRLPKTVVAGVPVQAKDVDSYVGDLIKYLREVHFSVQRIALAAVEKEKQSLGGSISAELNVGDPVLVRREYTNKREGPSRFQERVYPGVYVIRKKVSPTTFTVGDIVDYQRPTGSIQPVHAERLVKLDGGPATQAGDAQRGRGTLEPVRH